MPRSVRLSTGYEVVLDGELLSILEALYKEVSLRRHLQVSYEDLKREIEELIGQMTDAERRSYLAESLFLNSVTYENEMLDAYVRRLTARKPPQTGGKKARGRSAGRST